VSVMTAVSVSDSVVAAWAGATRSAPFNQAEVTDKLKKLLSQDGRH